MSVKTSLPATSGKFIRYAQARTQPTHEGWAVHCQVRSEFRKFGLTIFNDSNKHQRTLATKLTGGRCV